MSATRICNTRPAAAVALVAVEFVAARSGAAEPQRALPCQPRQIANLELPHEIHRDRHA